jgi:glycolate dehydrogenase FAD-binding subunit
MPGMDSSALLALLPAAIVSADNVAGYAVDGITPAVVIRPSSQEQVAEALRIAGEVGTAVLPFGGRTQAWLGMPPERYDVALDLRGVAGLIEHEPADLTVTVEAGIRLSSLQAILGEKGQWLPLDPHLPDAATIGGVLATNASGPARIARGTARDLVIGMTVATAQAELVKSGGRVVKNVAGYDLAKLHIGALGTTGVIVQVSFKVAPLPVRDARVLVKGDLEQLTRLSEAVQDARLALMGAVLATAAGSPGWQLGLRFGAGDAAVERSLRDTRTLAGEAGLALEDLDAAGWRSLLPAYDSTVVARASVPPSDLPRVAGALAGTGAAVSALPGAGVAHAMWEGAIDPARLYALRQACVIDGGALVIEKAPAETKRAIDVWGEPRGDFPLMQRLKHELDPGRVLSPGRYVGGI